MKKVDLIWIALAFDSGRLQLMNFKKTNSKFKLMSNFDTELELPISKMIFVKNYNHDLLVGTTLGYLVLYQNIEHYGLYKNLVINNHFLEESIVDV